MKYFNRKNITLIYNYKSLFIGRRSRRNSVSEDSQLTIENFGGSQDQLNMIGRAFEREKSVTNIMVEPAVPVRSSMADARGSILFDYDDTLNTEKQDHETEKQAPIPLRRKSQIRKENHLEGNFLYSILFYRIS